MSLRTKLVVALVVCTWLAAGAVGVLSYRSTAQRLRSEVDRSLEQAVSEVTLAIDQRPPGRPAGAALRGPREIDLQLLAVDGSTRRVPGTSPLPVDEADLALAASSRRGAQRFRDDTVGSDPIRVLTTSTGDSSGAVQAARNIAETQRVLAALRVRVLVVALAVAAIAAVIGLVIARRLTRRLTDVTAAAVEVAATGTLDVTVPVEGSDESARLGNAFNEMLAALSQSRADQQRLVQDAGHELRTPMTSLRTNLFALRNIDGLDDAARRQVLADIELETEELSRLIDEVIEVATDRRGNEPLGEVDLAALTERVATRTAAQWDRGVDLAADRPAVVVGRRGALARAVRNLVENACKFDTSASRIEVRVSSTPQGGGRAAGVSVEVLDRGPGFDPGDLERVFQRFYRSVAARSLPGSGLGLSIVAEVAAAHGGTVEAFNRSGGGAQVSLWIPLGPSSEALSDTTSEVSP